MALAAAGGWLLAGVAPHRGSGGSGNCKRRNALAKGEKRDHKDNAKRRRRRSAAPIETCGDRLLGNQSRPLSDEPLTNDYSLINPFLD